MKCDTGATVAPLFSLERLLRLFTRAPKAFWRFDVDVSLGAAAQAARFAWLGGVQATFYIMPRGEFYNPFSDSGAAALNMIREAGHTLAIHCDHHAGEIMDTVTRDARLLDTAYPGWFATRLVSFHMPSRDVLWRDFPDFENAYAAQWQGRYVSDSRREWNEAKERRVTDNVQVCLHAEHWFT